MVSQLPPTVLLLCRSLSAQSNTALIAWRLYRLTLSFNNSMFLGFHKRLYFIKSKLSSFCCLGKVILNSYCWHFISSWNQLFMLHRNWVQVLVMVIPVPMNHIHWDSTVTYKATFNQTGVTWGFNFLNRVGKSAQCWGCARLDLRNYVMSANMVLTITHQFYSSWMNKENA